MYYVGKHAFSSLLASVRSLFNQLLIHSLQLFDLGIQLSEQ